MRAGKIKIFQSINFFFQNPHTYTNTAFHCTKSDTVTVVFSHDVTDRK